MVKMRPTNQDSKHFKGSLHTGVSPNRHDVRIRHPENGAHVPPETPAQTLMEIPGGMHTSEFISIDQPCMPFADRACYLLDDFSRTAAGGTWSDSGDGGAWGSTSAAQTFQSDENPFQYYSVGDNINDVWSTLGRVSYPWTRNPGLGCGGLAFTFTGWMEKEAWYSWTVPTYPTDMAGLNLGPITFTAPTGLAGGTVGQAEGARVVVKSSEPTAMREGTFVANLANGVATTVFIPEEYIPAAGGTLHVGIQPNWYADVATGYTCGFRWPWMDGQGNSAKAGVSAFTDTLTWQSYDTGNGDWGSGASDDDTGAWWVGSLPWVVSGPDGGSWGLSGDSLYLTQSAGSQAILTATMAGESEADLADDNDDAVGEPWTLPTGVAMKARFKITTAGSTTESGSRYLRFRWASGRDLITAEVKLGDTAYNEGFLLYDGEGYTDSANYTEKAITEGSWMWLVVDSRNPEYLKCKMYAESNGPFGGEPAKWDAVIYVGDDADNPVHRDYFEIVMSAGNGTGADQTIKVEKVYFCGSGEDCDWVEEYMGQGDDETYRFYTAQPYKPASLWFFVDGMHTRTTTEDHEQGKFITPYSIPAAESAILVARYRVDENPAGD